jgi:hypothetical protein
VAQARLLASAPPPPSPVQGRGKPAEIDGETSDSDDDAVPLSARAVAVAEEPSTEVQPGDMVVVMWTSEWSFEDEEGRWVKGEPDSDTEWFEMDFTPKPHTPLFTAVVLENKPKVTANHLGITIKGGLPNNLIQLRVRTTYTRTQCTYPSCFV